MKKFTVIKIFLTCIFSFAAANIFAQHNPILDNYFIAENNGKVFLNWTIVSGSTCNGIQIYRSTDNISYTQIGSIAGICGSSSSPVNYNFTDENPVKNKTNCYRLELGGNGSSEILSVEIIDIANGGYQIRPNPFSIQTKIYFDNNRKQKSQLSIFNLTGKLVFATSSNEDFFELNAIDFLSGIYFFSITTEENLPKASGKIEVQ